MELKGEGDPTPTLVCEAAGGDKGFDHYGTCSGEFDFEGDVLSSDEEKKLNSDIYSDKETTHSKEKLGGLQTAGTDPAPTTQCSLSPRTTDDEGKQGHRLLQKLLEVQGDCRLLPTRKTGAKNPEWLFGARIKDAAGLYDDDPVSEGFPQVTLKILLKSISKEPEKYQFLGRNLLRLAERRRSHIIHGTLVFMRHDDFEPQDEGGRLCVRNGEELNRIVRSEWADVQDGPTSISPEFISKLFNFDFARFHYRYTPRAFSGEEDENIGGVEEEKEAIEQQGWRRTGDTGEKEWSEDEKESGFLLSPCTESETQKKVVPAREFLQSKEWKESLVRLRHRFSAVNAYSCNRKGRIEQGHVNEWEPPLHMRELSHALPTAAVKKEAQAIKDGLGGCEEQLLMTSLDEDSQRRSNVLLSDTDVSTETHSSDTNLSFSESSFVQYLLSNAWSALADIFAARENVNDVSLAEPSMSTASSLMEGPDVSAAGKEGIGEVKDMSPSTPETGPQNFLSQNVQQCISSAICLSEELLASAQAMVSQYAMEVSEVVVGLADKLRTAVAGDGENEKNPEANWMNRLFLWLISL